MDKLPLAFTEHGCFMLCNVLKSARAVEVSILVIDGWAGRTANWPCRRGRSSSALTTSAG
jgi:hypothetical protein